MIVSCSITFRIHYQIQCEWKRTSLSSVLCVISDNDSMDCCLHMFKLCCLNSRYFLTTLCLWLTSKLLNEITWGKKAFRANAAYVNMCNWATSLFICAVMRCLRTVWKRVSLCSWKEDRADLQQCSEGSEFTSTVCFHNGLVTVSLHH